VLGLFVGSCEIKNRFCVFIIDDVLSISKDTQLKQRRMSRVLQIGKQMRLVPEGHMHTTALKIECGGRKRPPEEEKK
jgi:hypothetical protein